MNKLKDNHNRVINYLRLSITDRCNLRCFYCVNDSIKFIPHNEILTYEEIVRLVKTAVDLGIKKVRLTGGEPFMRAGVLDFIDELSEIKKINDLSITTNGILLKKNLNRIKKAGIKRLNISLDTLSRQKFEKITGKDYFNTVWESILEANSEGFNPIKINVVAIKDVNLSELTDFAKLTYEYPFHIRFIEYMPMGEINLKNGLLTPDIKKEIEKVGELKPVIRNSMDGPARRFKLDGAIGEIGFISPLSNHFCSECNRLRLTSDGHLRPCLLSDTKIDVKTPLRNGASEKELREVFGQAAQFKQDKHHLKDIKNSVKSKMQSIGG